MRAHYLQHVHFESLGSIEGWLRDKGDSITSTQLYLGETLPKPDEIDFLIIMGGPMSVHDELDYPWLQREKAFIKQCLNRCIPTLGICLGAQLIASVSRGEVFPTPEKEIGWFPVKATHEGGPQTFKFPGESTVFHWHGETFSIPPHATVLAESEGCAHQAFQMGPNVIGLQFHLETTPTLAQALTQHRADELVPGTYIQDRKSILNTPGYRYKEIHNLMAKVLEYLHSS